MPSILLLYEYCKDFSLQPSDVGACSITQNYNMYIRMKKADALYQRLLNDKLKRSRK